MPKIGLASVLRQLQVGSTCDGALTDRTIARDAVVAPLFDADRHV